MTASAKYGTEWSDDDVPTEELARRQGVRPITSLEELDTLAHPELWDSDDEYEEFLEGLVRVAAVRHRVSYLVLDTDVASGILRDRLHSTLRRQLVGSTLAITFVTLGELTKWTLVRHWGPSKQSTFDKFLASVVVLPYSVRSPEPRR